ncbi:hypothetical protein KIN20_002700 [Parelaphostrongylus tenuis]|uniref:Uncharacterized protein n=1 Tax=Parelaphostrongylus tenuis TaxID=148309 RepID=A0AAD5MEK5_PARTN|nr:hypothetical protein KIN20_002700 [Parelaphostrongylus tenuis]
MFSGFLGFAGNAALDTTRQQAHNQPTSTADSSGSWPQYSERGVQNSLVSLSPGTPLTLPIEKSTCHIMEELGSTMVLNSANSPDIFTKENHLFRVLKEHLREQEYYDHNRLKNDLSNFFSRQAHSQ